MPNLATRVLLTLIALLPIQRAAWADLAIPGADGSDGAFSPAADATIDLSLARTGAWDSPGNGDGRGVYDPSKWAVVFKYSSVNVPAGVTVTFKNHPSGAPVVWLVSGNAGIEGILSLTGQDYVAPPSVAEPGPGGFAGGINGVSGLHDKGGGFGIGGGDAGAYGGNHATTGRANTDFPTYGTFRVLPLIGGSGGGGGGGAGGGAMLLAVAGTASVDGQIAARGGSGGSWAGGGAGGAVRLVAATIAGTGSIWADGGSGYGGAGGLGRIRIEAVNANATWDLQPATTVMAPTLSETDDTVLIWLPDSAPTVRILSVGGAAAPADPRASYVPEHQDLTLDLMDESPIVLETTNVDPTGSVKVRISPQYGTATLLDAVFSSGNRTQATWTATATLPQGYFTVQAHAVNPAAP